MRVTLTAVNKALADLGVEERLFKGGSYFYFAEGNAASWPSSMVLTPRLGSRTVEQWIAAYNELKAAAGDRG